MVEYVYFISAGLSNIRRYSVLEVRLTYTSYANATARQAGELMQHTLYSSRSW